MVTIQIHVSDDTAEALARWRPIHEKSESVLRAQIGLLVAEHPDECTDATCPELVRIEAAKELLKRLECVSRFTHDVINATKCAARS